MRQPTSVRKPKQRTELQASGGNLPVQLTALIGREQTARPRPMNCPFASTSATSTAISI